MPISEDVFDESGKDSSRRCRRWTLTNSRGGAVQIIDYGAAITSFRVPARDGEVIDVVLGYDDLKSYESSPFYLGCTVGRCANRIGGAEFHLDGRRFPLAANNGVNHLHGGVTGFDKKVWQLHQLRDDNAQSSLSLRLLSPDGDEGYPGEIRVTVTFSLAAEANALSICYRATTSAPTVVNLTNHSYFNLSGHDYGTVYDQNLQIFGSKYLRTDDSGLSVGDPIDVDGTVYDYRNSVMMGYRLEHMINDKNPHGGLDNSFVDFVGGDNDTVSSSVIPTDEAAGDHKPVPSSSSSCFACGVCAGSIGPLNVAAILTSDVKKIRLKVSTTKPALHVYSGNYLDGSWLAGKGGARYARHCGICFETQIHPDAINRTNFPSPILRPNQTYHHLTVFDVAERPPLQWL